MVPLSASRFPLLRAIMLKRIRIALIDDDAAVLDSLRLYLERNDVVVSAFSTADAFLAILGDTGSVDCVVADVRMPGLSGIDLVREMATRSTKLPIILITAHGDVDMAVAAIKLGAFDFIEKPFDESRLLESIRQAIEVAAEEPAASEDDQLKQRIAGLTDRQRQVMKLAAAGLSNKEIAIRLGISPRTVENHRAWMMERMGARNLAELIRLVAQLGSGTSERDGMLDRGEKR
jgi:two-component system, LuxR family, response regulator FixJ